MDTGRQGYMQGGQKKFAMYIGIASQNIIFVDEQNPINKYFDLTSVHP